MFKTFSSKYIRKSTPRSVIVLIDVALFLLSLFISYLIRFDIYSNIDELYKEWQIIQFSLPIVLITKLLVYFILGIQKGIIRYTSFEDLRRIFLASFISSILIFLLGLIRYFQIDNYYLIPTSVLFVDFLSTMILLIAFRFTVKTIYFEENKDDNDQKSKLIIYGAGVSGMAIKNALERESKFEIVCFIDDDKKISGKRLQGKKVYHTDEFEKLIKNLNPNQLIIAIEKPDRNKVSNIIDICLKHKIQVQSAPDFKSWINGQISMKQIRNVHIEDLLGREPIILDQNILNAQIANKIILVTGAAGSIGSGLVFQLCSYSPKKIILLDQSESGLYDLNQELTEKGYKDCIEIVIGDIRIEERMNNLFRTFKPQLVFHAAAYKHVPLMEMNPSEAINTNVKGTRNIVNCADKFGVEKFIFISTDKAVNPTNVMGASKRIAEIYAHLLNRKSKTQFIITRFGNVLGSNGSVIPLFKKQIANGGPLTVTNENVTRYFMTIPEACQLVLEASVMGEGGEIFVFDMGKSVKILDLAKKMIQLSGLILNQDIEIKITGLRPGEKLFEELLANEENTLPTHHPQILKAKLRDEPEQRMLEINELIELFDSQNNTEIVKMMKKIVPEFISNNSEYVALDE